MSEEMIPKVRFSGFTDPWEQRKLGDLIETYPGKSFIALSHDIGRYPVIEQGDKPILGYSNEKPFRNFKTVTLFGDHTLSLYKPQGPFLLATDGIKIISISIFNDKFTYYFLLVNKPMSEGYKRHFKILKNKIGNFPNNIREQEGIGKLLNNFDHLIALHQKKLEQLQTVKKLMLQKIFSQEWRFSGFTDPWEQRKLKELADFNPKSDLPEIFEYVDLESVTGTILVNHRLETKTSAPSRAQRVAQTGDLFYQMVRPYQKNNYLYKLPYDNYVFSTGYAQLRPHDSGEFLLALTQREDFVNRVLERCTGTGYPAINSNDLASISVKVPVNSRERHNIGEIIDINDSLIALHQKKLDQLEEMKKWFLQNLFV